MDLAYALAGLAALVLVASACALAAGFGYGLAQGLATRIGGGPRQPRPRKGKTLELPIVVRTSLGLRADEAPSSRRIIKRPPDPRRPRRSAFVRYGDRPGGASSAEREALEARLLEALEQRES
jgi:hypothetical protein